MGGVNVQCLRPLRLYATPLDMASTVLCRSIREGDALRHLQRCLVSVTRQQTGCAVRPHSVIDRTIRIDHAGEFGANRIYAGQYAVLGRTHVGPVVQVCSWLGAAVVGLFWITIPLDGGKDVLIYSSCCHFPTGKVLRNIVPFLVVTSL